MRYFAANGGTSIATLARNLLVHESGAVMIVADSDTHDPERARNDRLVTEFALRDVAPSGGFDVFLFVPEIEVIFFECPSVLDTLRAGTSHDSTLVRHGRDVPKRTLDGLLNKMSFDAWVTSLSPDSWRDLRKGEQARALLDALAGLAFENRQVVAVARSA